MLAVVVSDVEVDGQYQFERRMFGSNPEQLRSLAAWLPGCSSNRSRKWSWNRLPNTGNPCAKPSNVLEGAMSASVGGQTIKGTAGSMIFLPRNVVHSFEIESEQMRMLVLLTPAGGEGYFKECSVPAPAMTLPPPVEVPYSEIEKLLTVGAKYGIEFVLPKP